MYRPYLALALVMSKTPEGNHTEARLEVFNVDGRHLHSPRPVNDRDIRLLINAIDKKAEAPRFRGMVPPEIFYLNGANMAFYLEAGVRRAFFRNDKDGKPEEVLLWLPAMVFHYKGPDHQLWAYFCTGTLQELYKDKARLMGAILPNITRGNVCLGSSMTKVTFQSDPEEMKEIIVERFFGSTFNEWRYKGMRELMEQFVDIAKDPDLKRVNVQELFWKNPPQLIKEYVTKEEPWKRPSHLFR